MKQKKTIGIIIAAVVVIAAVITGIFFYQKNDSDNQKSQKTETTQQQKKTTKEKPKEEPIAEPESIPEPQIVYTEQSQTVWTTTKVNFRAADNTTSEVLAVLSPRTELTSSAFSEKWYKVTYNGKEGYVSAAYLTIEEPAPQVTGGHVIVIDPGHQSSGDSSTEPNGPGSSTMKARVTGGTTGRTTGVPEYQLTMNISNQLKVELESRGYTVYMTRTSNDVNISNKERAEYASSVGADISVRIHANGVDDTSVSGAMTLAPSASNPYVGNLAAQSQSLSRCIIDSYCSATGLRNQGVVKSDTMTGINWSTVPVTIIEMGYMTNPSDDTNMQDSAFQQRMVQGIANGIDNYFQ